MRRPTILQISILVAAALSIVLLSFVRTTPSSDSRFMKAEPKQMMQKSNGHSIDDQLAAARKRFPPALSKTVQLYESSISTTRSPVERSMAYDSLATVLGRANEMVAAAWYTEQKVMANNGSGNDWSKAGERWYGATGFVKSEEDQPALYEEAMRCFTKALELEPKNLSAQVGLGVCYVEATSDPMKGVGLLKGVLDVDSTNVDALMNLGQFAERSQQYDKAIGRYQTVLRLHPDYISVWLKLAEVYQAMGDKKATIDCLEKYLSLETDPVFKNDIENALNRLKNSN